MLVAGLTGSIAMGKSTVGNIFASLGASVFDADAAVREYYAGIGAKAVEEMFPGVLVEGRIDRDRLGRRVMGDAAALLRLEVLVHPEIANARATFIQRAAADGRWLTVIDIPLLLESNAETSVDIVVVVTTTETIQRTRALERARMTNAKLEAILARQMPDVEKRGKAHFLIDTSGSLAQTRAQVTQFVRAAGAMKGHLLYA